MINSKSINKLCFLLLTGFIVIAFSLRVSAQGKVIELEETLKYINGKLGKKFLVEVESGQAIKVKFFDDKGKLIRDDYVKHVKELDINNIFYDENEKALIMPCKEDFKGCVDRQLYVNRFHRTYSRINYVVNLDEKSAKGLTRAFTHLLALLSNPEYKSSEPFE